MCISSEARWHGSEAAAEGSIEASTSNTPNHSTDLAPLLRPSAEPSTHVRKAVLWGPPSRTNSYAVPFSDEPIAKYGAETHIQPSTRERHVCV